MFVEEIYSNVFCEFLYKLELLIEDFLIIDFSVLIIQIYLNYMKQKGMVMDIVVMDEVIYKIYKIRDLYIFIFCLQFLFLLFVV